MTKTQRMVRCNSHITQKQSDAIVKISRKAGTTFAETLRRLLDNALTVEKTL